MSREALVLLVCCCDFRDGAERLISSKSLRNAVIRAFPGLFRILRMCAPRRAAAVVRPRGREKSADRRRRILISRLLIIRASVPRRKSPFPAYFKGFPAVSPLIPPYPAFLKYPVSPHTQCIYFMACTCSMKINFLRIVIVDIVDRNCIGISVISIYGKNATSAGLQKSLCRVDADFIFLFTNCSDMILLSFLR